MRWLTGGVLACLLGVASAGMARAENATLKPDAEDDAVRSLAEDPESARKLGEFVAERNRRQAEDARKVREILDDWERWGLGRTEVDARFRRIDVKGGPFKGRTEYRGMALFKAPDIACFDLQARDPGDPAKWTFCQRIATDGREIRLFFGETHTLNIFPADLAERENRLRAAGIPADARSLNALESLVSLFISGRHTKLLLEQYGAPAFLRPIRAETLLARFRVTLEEESAKSYRLRLVPTESPGLDFFAQLRLDLDKAIHSPSAMQFTDSNGKETQTYIIESIKPVLGFDPVTALQQKPPKGWKVITLPRDVLSEPAGEAPTPPVEAAGPPR